MKRKILFSFLIIGLLFGCQNQTEIILQNEEKVIEVESTEYNFPDKTTGSVDFDYFIHSDFTGSITFLNQDEIVFEYQINTKRKLYPLTNKKGMWQHISLEWNLENSSLRVFIDKKLQTTRLISSEKATSINKFVFNPRKTTSKNDIKIRKVICKGKSTTLPKRFKIVTFGDSTTAFRKTISEVYSQRLPELLLKTGIPNIVFNEGVGGSHTGRLVDNDRHKVKHALDRIDSNVLSKNPDVTIVCFGINDSHIDDGKDEPRISLIDFEKNYNTIIKKLQDIGSEIIIMTPNALGKRHEKWRFDTTTQYVKIIRKLAEKHNLVLLDQWKIFEEYSRAGKNIDDLLLDGTHPNDIWHEELAGRIAKEIEKMFK